MSVAASVAASVGATPVPADGCAGSDAAEAATVRAGWLVVGVAERLGSGATARLFALEEEAAVARARDAVADLVPWPAGGERVHMYESPANRRRFCRTLDLLRPGDRVLDIGLGLGYQPGVLLRDGALAAYHGVDLVESNVEATADMLRTNGLERPEVTLAQGDLYELRRDEVAAFGPDLVICCEVLEHVPDPERALRVLADVLPDGGELLVSVPLLGRLDGVWGHLTRFDSDRVRAMVAAAGLFVHHVEALANTWVFMLLSKDPAPSDRVPPGPAILPSATPLTHRDWVPVDLDAVDAGRWVKRVASCQVTTDAAGALVRVSGARSRWSRLSRRGQYGGLSLDVPHPHGLRLELDLVDAADIVQVIVDGFAGADRVARWVWTLADSPAKRRTSTVLLYPGRSTPRFKGSRTTALGEADHVEVFAKVRPGGTAAFRLRRAAYLR